jgi:hypothetical protein
MPEGSVPKEWTAAFTLADHLGEQIKEDFAKKDAELKPLTSVLPPVTAAEVYQVTHYGKPSDVPKGSIILDVRAPSPVLTIDAKKAVKGSSAEELASKWRALDFSMDYSILRFSPSHVLRFFSGKTLILEAIIGFSSHNFRSAQGGSGFHPSAESTKLLKSHLDALLSRKR